MEKKYIKTSFDKKKLKKKDSSPKRKIIIAILLIGFAFSGSFLIYYIMQVSLSTETPMVVVVSGSMRPNLLEGDLLFLKGKDPALIKNGTLNGKEGDIIVFDARELPGWMAPPSEPIVHRVIAKKYDNGWFFLTKGDANPSHDSSWIPDSRVIGVVVGRIPYIGWVKILLTDSGLLVPLLVIVSALLIISIVWDIIKGDDEKGKDKRSDKLIFLKKTSQDEEVEEIDFDFTK
ncbi:hypothetical protein LCGC14_3128860 [marine sediment metagenome]|uniref:Peptidase S26 domain-containing protein n=1 Tax=marine sediment metagenome TaxID=412755 RepID=A0A0F8WP35_9ZZZZ